MSARRSRTALLIATVSLSAMLIAAVACAMASVHKGIHARVAATVGAADLRIQNVGKQAFDTSVLDEVRAWPETDIAMGRLYEAVPLKNARTGKEAAFTGTGVEHELEYKAKTPLMVEGRTVRAPGEIVLDTIAAKELDARVGDVLDVAVIGTPIKLTVVGIARQPPLGAIGKPEVFLTLAQTQQLAGRPGRLSEIDIIIKSGQDPEATLDRRAPAFEEAHGKALVLRLSSKITSGLVKNIQSSQIGLIISSMLSFLAAAFIIMTGLTTNVTERQRELAVLRCIGASRSLLAKAQLAVGVLIGVIGAAIGVPLGIAGAALMVKLFPEQLPSGFAVSWLGIPLAVAGSVGAGLIGASWPAFRASQTSPLEALAARSRTARRSGILLCGLIGLVLAAIHVAVLLIPTDGQVVFWLDITIGLPSLFTGYFLLGVPTFSLVARLAAPTISKLMGLPGGSRGGILGRTVLATPYRHGFTSGAMMVGLAILVAIWTNGRAVERDWLGSLKFPDAFVHGRNLTEETQQRIEQIPGVTGTAAITLQSLKTDAFGIKGLQDYSTTFVAFEPRKFFDMTALHFVDGDQATAVAELERGGAILVAREFKVAKGVGVGDTLALRYNDKSYEFRVVGVVVSPGLDIASKYFDIGDEYLEQAVNSVFGSRDDLKTIFGNDAISLLQIGIDPAADDKAVMADVRKLVGVGVISAGTGRQIKEEIRTVLSGSLLVFSVVAIAAMLVACLGVANLIIAGIQARGFEFGVLRAIGAQRGLIARLVMGEAVLIALSACVLGTI
ncbi:MAG: hypothetical protein H7Y88_01340, partial [Phycisphaerales bacterium]|nr:hypothetical protein [Phycisphaerales bacterium]